MHTTRLKPVLALGLAAAAVLTLSACGSSGAATTAATSAAADTTLAALLPAAVKDKGSITVAAAVYAPAVIQPTGGGAVTGWDIEITRDAAALLGLKVNFAIIPFDGVIPGLQAGRYDAATGEINVTPERSKVVTFVTNHVSQDAMIVPASSPKSSFATEADVCGLTIGASLGSSEAATAQALADKCTQSAATTVSTFQTQAQVDLALSQGRIGAAIASGSQAAYTVKQTGGKFKVATLGFGEEIKTGLALANNAGTAQLAKAFQAATQKLIDNGTVQKILNEQNGGLGAITTSEIIGSASSS